jgi:hypothetical protein
MWVQANRRFLRTSLKHRTVWFVVENRTRNLRIWSRNSYHLLTTFGMLCKVLTSLTPNKEINEFLCAKPCKVNEQLLWNDNNKLFIKYSCQNGARGSVVGWVTMLQAGRPRVRVPMRSLGFFFNLPNPSSRTMALGSTQPLTEMSTRNLPGG